jgi:acylphosphatase
MIRKRAVARGRVQGVFYRQSCVEHAVAAGVAGWVRNRDDGTVEAVLEGDADAVEAVLAWMAEGPPQAVVVGVDVQDEVPTGERGFTVR